MSGLTSPNNQRKQSNASGHSVDLAEPSTLKGSSKREFEDDDDIESNEEESPKSEKRAGRRKIKIEYIDDKSRRHITFSKRKAGIMKKAYELSTLTGTQVLLLVVSETGLVYTFTTPKLQPLVTKPEGKNLIQACLNAPDAPSGQDPPNTTRSTQNPPVYGNDGSASVDANGDVYNDDRKPQTSGGQLSQTQPSYALGLSPYNQYSGIPNMTLGTSGIASQYMPSAGYPQYGQQHLNQYAPNNPYMQQYWGPGGNKVPQYPNQSPEKK
ncbi:126_t:CDS:2 [Cetraspora pellucida]|uniref:126_t:CDS:1 n=1 Tax=Cetraspora pellucida TaxID=1433469 RepID=A0A9N8W1M0_9GLOM|nr:126_t:CDS:2 [Cetraspora pellucida]